MFIASLICSAIVATPLSSGDWQPGDPFFPDPSQLPAEPTWIPLDDLGAEKPGMPPTIDVAGVAGQTMDRVEITLHGFWVEPFRHADRNAHERFLSFRIPGMTTLGEVGMPALPTLSFAWGLATNTQELAIVTHEEMDVVGFDNARVAPFQGPVMETAEGGQVPPFSLDEGFYQEGNGGSWPEGHGGVATDPGMNFGGIRFARGEFTPFRFDPRLNRLEVTRTIHAVINRPGEHIDPLTLGRSWTGIVRELLENAEWMEWTGVIKPNPFHWNGRYLIIHPEEWLDELQPLITLKQQRGYNVDLITIESMINTDSSDFYNEILNWYFSYSARDKYVLLVGDSALIPHRDTTVLGTGASDALYAFMNADNSPDLWLGRFPAESDAECAFMVEKSVQYQSFPGLDPDFYTKATLAAHPGEADAYLDCIDMIMANNPGYDIPRTFIDRGGDTSAGKENLVMNDIAVDHVGLVLYRGHGSYTEWWEWDFNGKSTDTSDTTLLPASSYNPVIYSIACYNHAIDKDSEAFGHDWMAHASAAASVSAHEPSYRYENNTFAEELMFLLQSNRTETIGSATMTALYEAAVIHGWSTYSHWNQQVYSIFGDPDLRVRNKTPLQLEIIDIGDRPLGWFVPTQLQVTDAEGNPRFDVLVAISGSDGPIVTVATDESGVAVIPALAELVPTPEDDKLTVRAWSDNQNAIDFVGFAAVEDAEELPGDIDGDGDIDGADLAALLGAWGGGAGPADVDGNGEINGGDLALLLGAWTG